MMNFLRIFLLLYILCPQSLFSSLLCKDIKLSEESFKLDNGTVNFLCNMGNNSIGIATETGLSRFDGFRFYNYPLIFSNNFSSKPISHAVGTINKDQDDWLFLHLQHGGIACFDSRKEQYIPVNFVGNPFDQRKITSIYVADKRLLYIGTTTGMYCAEVKTIDKGNNQELEVSLSKPLLTGHVSKITGDDKGNLFFCLNSKRVLQYSMGTQQTREFFNEVKNDKVSAANISMIYLFQEYLFVFPKYGVPMCYDTRGKENCSLLNNNGKYNKEFSDTYVTGMDSADGETFYISTWNGLFCLKFDSKALTKTSFNLEKVSDDKQMTAILYDNSHGVLWVGFNGKGVKRIDINHQNGIYTIPMNWSVNGIAEDAKGYIWLVTEKGGIRKSVSPTLTPNMIFEQWSIEKGNDGARCIYKDKNGNLWIGCENASVLFINPISGESANFRLKPQNNTDFDASIEGFCLDGHNRLWVITSEGLILYDRRSGNCSWGVKNDQDLTVYSVVEDSEDNIWVGTSNGLKRLNLLPGKIELTGQYEKEAGCEPTAAFMVFVNEDNLVWVSYGDRIMRIDPNEKQKTLVFSLQDNLKSGAVLCISGDKNGNTWMGCSSGIAMLRSHQNTIYNTFSGENCKSVCSLRNGQMLWSGSQGLFYFASAGKVNRGKTLVLSGIQVNGSFMPTNKSAEEKRIFKSDENIHFYFSDVQFDGTQQSIAYRLLPDENWQSGLLEDGIFYSKLPGGNYKLQVKLIYPDGSEGDMIELPVIIENPWWKMGWLYMLLSSLIIGLFLTVYLVRMKKRKAGNIILQSSALIRQNTFQSAFLGRFMQDLRAPLSVTIGLLKEVIQNKKDVSDTSSKLLVAYRNSVGVQKICDQILDIRNYGNMTDTLSVAPYTLSKIIDSFLYSMNELLHVYSIEFDYQKEDTDTDVWIDKDKIMFVLRNLLANALVRIRYTGIVTLSVRKTSEDGRVYYSIILNDNGKCIVKDLQEITDSELAEDETVNVVLGLKEMREIVHRHHGALLIKSDLEKGTSVIMKLPTEKEVFVKDQYVEFVIPELLYKPDFSVDNLIDLNISLNDEDLSRISDEKECEKKDRDKPTILIVEDNLDIRLYLKVLFEGEYNILQAENGLEGIKIAKKELPDLIVSDIMMPLKNGYQYCKEIKEGLDTCHIPFIMLTAKIEDEDVLKGLEVGADDYILKPFKPNLLKARVKSLIQVRLNLKQMYTELLKPSFTKTEEIGEEEIENKVEDPFIGSVIKIIEENIQQEDFSVKKLASELNMSQPTLYRKVKQYTDFTIIELIRGVRLRKAATLLQTKRYPVQEVAEMVGYNDIPTFRKHFVDMFGTTPSTYAPSNK